MIHFLSKDIQAGKKPMYFQGRNQTRLVDFLYKKFFTKTAGASEVFSEREINETNKLDRKVALKGF